MLGTEDRAAVLRRVLLGGSVIAATLPVVVAGVRAARGGWIPTWDRSYPALRAWDVFTRHSPLLGTRSTASNYGDAASHPGPLEFQALAPWVRLFGLGDGTALGVAFLNAVCIVAVVWLAFRRGGHIAALLAAAAMASLTWSMGSVMLYDPWPPHVVLFPFAVFLTAAWSTADKDLVALPVLVLSGSFVLQSHLGYSVLVPAVALLSIGLLCRRLRSERRDGAATTSGARRRVWVVLALGIGLACWALPLYEQISGRYRGNLGSLIDAAGSPRGGSAPLDAAVRIVGGTMALPPWWFPPSFTSPPVDVVGEGVSLPLAVAGLCALATVLVVGVVRSWRRGRTAIATGLGLALVTVPLAVYTADNAPMGIGISVAYLRSIWVLAAFAGMMLALAVADEVRQRRPAPPSGSVAAPAVVAAVTLVVSVLALPHADRSGIDATRSVEATHDLAAQILPEVAGEGTVLVELIPDMSDASWVGPGMLVELHEAGVPFVVRDPALVRQLGNYRAYDGGNADLRLTVVAGPPARDPWPVPPSVRVVARLSGLTSAERDELAQLRSELRDDIERAGGLPLDRDPLLSDSGYIPELEDEIDRMIADVVAVGDDPDEVLDSDELVSLLHALDGGFAAVDDVVDPEAVPTDDLVRYGRLQAWRTQRTIVVYLEELPHR